MIKLKKTPALIYNGNVRYIINYDHDAGRKNVYKILIDNSNDPVTIGRELDLKTVRELIDEYEKEFFRVRNYQYFGTRNHILGVCEYISDKRAKRIS